MKTARRSSWEQGIRINYVAPCYIRSAIRSAEYEKSLMEKGVVFGEQEDVAACMMRIACDRSIDGKIRSSTLCPPPLFPFFFFFCILFTFFASHAKEIKDWTDLISRVCRSLPHDRPAIHGQRRFYGY